MIFIDIEKSRKQQIAQDTESFQENLHGLFGEMNRIQIGKFLTISVARSIIYINKNLLKTLDSKKCEHYFNLLFISLGFNCILFFNKDIQNRVLARALALDRALDRARTHAFDLDRALAPTRTHALALDLALARTLDRDLARARPRPRAIARALDLDLAHDLDLARSHAIDLDRALDHACANIKLIMIEDAKAILRGKDGFSYNSVVFRDYEYDFSAFLAVLRDLNSKYWAEWFKRLFSINFCLDNKDIEEIYSLKESLFTSDRGSINT